MKKYKDYINTDFTADVIEFNCATGIDRDNQTIEELVDAINLQADIVREELVETIMAWGDDDVETLDGIADLWYTLVNINTKMNNLPEDEESGLYLEKNVNVKKLELISKLCDVVLNESDSGFTDEQLISASKLVVQNNKLKYTDHKLEFDSWEYPKNLKPRITDFNGKLYYCLVDENGKVSKHNNFKKVCLEDILKMENTQEGINEKK